MKKVGCKYMQAAGPVQYAKHLVMNGISTKVLGRNVMPGLSNYEEAAGAIYKGPFGLH